METAPIGDANLEDVPSRNLPVGLPAQIAGALIALNGIATFVVPLFIPSEKMHGMPIFDFLIGFPLMAGRMGALPWARLRAWVGLVLGTAFVLHTAGLAEAIGQVMYCLLIVLLVTGRPGKARLIFAGLLAFSCAGLLSIGLFLMSGPGSRWLNSKTGMESIPDSGDIDSPVHLHLPKDWVRFGPEKAAEAKAKLLLYNQQEDVYLACYTEATSEEVSLDDVRETIVSKMYKNVSVKSEKKTSDTLRICFEAESDGHKLRYHELIKIKGKDVTQLSSWYELPVKASQETEIEGILDSYR